MNGKIQFFKLLSVAALLAATSAAQAAITVYTTQSSYLAAISAPGVDTYDDLNIGLTNTPLTRQAGAYSYTASTGPSAFFPAGDGGDHYLATNDRNDTIVFSNFSANVRGVGGAFFGSDFDGYYQQGGTVVLTARSGADSTTYTITNATNSSFLGFVSTGGFTSLSVSSATDLWPTVNNLTLGVSAVPEPQTYGMMLAGLALLGAAARRRKA